MEKNNYIAFSLWGDSPIYNIGATQNVKLAQKIYPDWKVIVYYDDSVPADTITRLQQQGVILQDMTASGIYGLFWRFLAADIPDCSHAIFRDTDSRLSHRERTAVDEWIANGDVLHIMRDHPFHEVPYGAAGLSILGGMWGIRGGVISLQPLIQRFIRERPDEYGIDQAFLQQIYERFGNSQTVHDEFFERRPFPVDRVGYQFIGERIDEHEQPIGEDREALKRHLSRHKPSWFKRIRKKLFAR